MNHTVFALLFLISCGKAQRNYPTNVRYSATCEFDNKPRLRDWVVISDKHGFCHDTGVRAPKDAPDGKFIIGMVDDLNFTPSQMNQLANYVCVRHTE